MTRAKLTLAAGFVLAAITATVAATAGGQGTQGRTITLTEVPKGASFGLVDAAPKTKFNKEGEPRRFSPGDEEIVSIAVADQQGNKVGRFDAYCLITRPGKPAHHEEVCTGTYRLGDGTISAVGSFVGNDANTFTGAVVGGTGAYEGARGTLTSDPGSHGTTDTIHLLP